MFKRNFPTPRGWEVVGEKKFKPLTILRKFEAAVRAHAWKGSQRPDDHEGIEVAYRASKHCLTNLLSQLRGPHVVEIIAQKKLTTKKRRVRRK